MWKIFSKELFSLKAVALIGLFGILYIILPGMLINYRLLFATAIHNYPLSYKIATFSLFLEWPFLNMQPVDIILLVINAFLVGMNILLIGKTLTILQHTGKIKLSVGGAAVLGFVTTGCTTCGLSLLSFLGVSASFSFLPFYGIELRLFAIGLLFVSLVYMLRQLHEAKYCKTPSRKSRHKIIHHEESQMK